MGKKPYLRRMARKCAERIGRDYKVKKVILIGSVAAGTVHSESDIDLVVEGFRQRNTRNV